MFNYDNEIFAVIQNWEKTDEDLTVLVNLYFL